MNSKTALLLAAVLLSLSGAGGHASAFTGPCAGTETWVKTGEQEFGAPFVLLRSQGVTHDETGWIFSWQGGLERATEDYSTAALGFWPPDNFSDARINADRTNHFGGTHIGDVDTIDGLIYAPIEDGEEDLGVVTLNDPEYQQSYVALYDAATLLYTGVKYPVPPELAPDGVPWVAIDEQKRELYTGAWNMPTDTFNVFDLELNFKRTLTLKYPESFGPDFHLSRIQGGEILNGAFYAARDDAEQTMFKIDLATGEVTSLFSLGWPEPAELEGLAIHPTADGALLHVILIKDNDFDDPRNFAKVVASFQHFGVVCS